MKELYCLDTNFIISYANRSDSNHQRAIEILDSVNSKDSILISPILVLAELIVDKNADDLVSIAKTLADEVVIITTKNIEDSLKIDHKIRSSLKSIDILIIELCKAHKATLLSFDKKLLKALESARL